MPSPPNTIQPPPVRVLLIAPSNEIVGGQTVQGDRLRQLFASRTQDVDLRFQPVNPLFPAPLRWVKRIPVARTILNALLIWTILFRRAATVDVLHIFTAGYWHFTLWTIPALLAARLWRRKAIVNYRDGQCDHHLRTHPWAAPALRHLADAVITPSGFLVDVFARHGIRAEAIVNVIDTSRFLDRRRSRLRPLLFSNRGLEPVYNIECILRAFRRIADRYPAEARLTVAHDGPSASALRHLAYEELGLTAEQCRFTGSISQAGMPRAYDEADIYVMTPNIDNMPGTLLECFASGIPVVSTNVGGIPYIATDGETALLTPKDDDAAVAAAVFRLLDDPALVERITENARREVRRYDGPPVAAAWIALYRRLTR